MSSSLWLINWRWSHLEPILNGERLERLVAPSFSSCDSPSKLRVPRDLGKPGQRGVWGPSNRLSFVHQSEAWDDLKDPAGAATDCDLVLWILATMPMRLVFSQAGRQIGGSVPPERP